MFYKHFFLHTFVVCVPFKSSLGSRRDLNYGFLQWLPKPWKMALLGWGVVKKLDNVCNLLIRIYFSLSGWRRGRSWLSIFQTNSELV